MLHNTNIRSTDGTVNMIRVLSKQKKGVKICHINAQSLNCKIDEFRLIFENSLIDIICVSETWLKEKTPDSLVSLRGYKIFRSDRKTHAGGVAIFVKDSIKCKFKCKNKHPDNNTNVLNQNNNVQFDRDKIEYLFVEIASNDKKLLVGCVYRPNRYIPVDSFMEKLEELTIGYSDLIIAGDFNSNLLSESMLVDNMLAVGLVPINRRMPTHYTTTTNTLLDLFFVNNDLKVQLYDQLSAPCFSKHDLIFAAYDFQLQHEVQSFTYRDFKNVNYQILEENCSLIEWSSMYNMLSTDEQLSFLNNNILNLFNSAVALKTKVIRENTRPWFSTAIKSLIDQRDLAYTRWKRFKIPLLKNEYCELRKQVNRAIRKAKSAHYAERFRNAIDSKKTWQTIRDIGIGKTMKSSNTDITADDLNIAFTNIPMSSNNPPVNNIINHNNYANQNLESQFEFRCVNEFEVLKAILSVKSNSIGYDGIDPRFIKILLPNLLPFLTFFFNKIFTSSVFPMQWKHAKVIPVPKSNSELRPIAIIPYLSKIMEKLMHLQINEYINNFNLLTACQSGFRSKHSCVTALINVSEDIRSEMDVGKINILVLLDHSKAFDTVDHAILSMKLRRLYNFSNTSTRLIESYLSGRSQSVFMNNIYSSALPVNKGVPQGSILGPLLFSLYVNDLPQHVKHSKIHLYADDVQLYISSSTQTIGENVRKLNDDLKNIYLWATSNNLCLNPRKSKCIVIHKKTTKINTNFDVMLNNQRIELVSSAKNLGIIFNNNLTWSNHVNSIVGKLYYMLRTLWQTQFYTPMNIRMLIAKVYLMPCLLYGCEVFANCDANSMNKLRKIFNNVIRYVFGLRKNSRVSAYSGKLYGMSLQNLMNIKVLTLLHKIIYLKEPSYLHNRLNFSRSGRGKKITTFRHRSETSKTQFFLHSVHLWNYLPNIFQTNNNTIAFKKDITKHFSR